jgi:hypothetical protein
MPNIKEQLDKIKSRISDKDFLGNKGLSNEVGIHVFCYDPADELVVRDYIKRMKAESSTEYKIIECDLYDIFLSILADKRIIDKVADIEARKGNDFLLRQLQSNVLPKDFLSKMEYEPKNYGDVLFLTGVGKVYPFMRSHKMLDSMQETFAKIPIVLFYPGEFNGQSLNLFDKFFDGNYYRAFNLL